MQMAAGGENADGRLASLATGRPRTSLREFAVTRRVGRWHVVCIVDALPGPRRIGHGEWTHGRRLGELDVLLDGSHGGIYSMAPVLIACPATDALVPTGTNASTLADLEPTNLLLDCPDCGRDHEWPPLDAVLSAYERRETAATG
jgi:hypothetical protein